MLKIAAVIVAAGATGCLHHGHGDGHYTYASTPVMVQPQTQPTYVDRQGRAVYADAYGRPVYDDGQPVDPANIVTAHPAAQTVIAPPIIYYNDHHVDHHDTHHDDHH